MKSIPDKSIDLILCDLPYDCLACEWDVMIDLKAFWEQVKRIRTSGSAPCIHFCNTRFGVEL
jgi:site-specific DNA-methyltransferase (adenine-specific)